MLRALLSLRPVSYPCLQACFMGTGEETTRRVIADVEDLIQPTPKPLEELVGSEHEAYEAEILIDETGKKVSPLGHSRSLITRLQEPLTLEPQDFRFKFRQTKTRVLREDQQYDLRGLNGLGSDLLAAHFLVRRGAKVKFIEECDWLSLQQILTVLTSYKKEDKPRIEAIDASDCSIVFEGFDYLRGLKHLRYLDLSRSHRLDDHCLHKLTFHLPKLECLDISDCPNVSERGLATLHALTNLKKLVLHNVEGVMHKQLICLLLEESNPNLFIDGVTYSVETIDREIEEDRKKYEARYGLRESVDYRDRYLSDNSSKVRMMEKLFKYLPKSSENGFLARFLGVRGADDRYEKIKEGF